MKIDIDITCPYCGKTRYTTIYMNAEECICWEGEGGCGRTYSVEFKTQKIVAITEKKKEFCMVCNKFIPDDELINGICIKCSEQIN